MVYTKENKKYFKIKYNKNKSFFARCIDIAAFAWATFIVSFMVCWYTLFSVKYSIIVAVSSTVSIIIISINIKRRKFNKFVQKEIESLKKKNIIEDILLKDTKSLTYFFKKILDIENAEKVNNGWMDEGDFYYIFYNHPDNPVSAQQILDVYRNVKNTATTYIFISPSNFSQNASILCKKICEKCELIEQNDIIELAEKYGLMPDDSEISQNIETDIRENIISIKTLKKTILDKNKAKNYAICAIIFTIWPFVFSYNLLITILAVICVLLAFFSHKQIAD